MAMDTKQDLASRLGIYLVDLSQVSFWDMFNEEEKEISEVVNGVTIIDIQGSLYKHSLSKIYDAISDCQTDRILFQMDSPGGEFLGTPELHELIKNCGKETIGFVSGMCCSGCYYLASACDKIIVTKASLLGSIGAISVVHTGGANEYSVFKSGKFKALGNGAEALTDEGKNRMQEKINLIAEQFYSAVSEGRGVSSEVIQSTHADSFYTFCAPEWMYDDVMTKEEIRKGILNESV
jgi:ClpP class serine protease